MEQRQIEAKFPRLAKHARLAVAQRYLFARACVLLESMPTAAARAGFEPPNDLMRRTSDLFCSKNCPRATIAPVHSLFAANTLARLLKLFASNVAPTAVAAYNKK